MRSLYQLLTQHFAFLFIMIRFSIVNTYTFPCAEANNNNHPHVLDLGMKICFFLKKKNTSFIVTKTHLHTRGENCHFYLPDKKKERN